MKKIAAGLSVLLTLFIFTGTTVQAQALTHLLNKGGIEFSANYLSYDRELRFKKYKLNKVEYDQAQLDLLNQGSGIKIKSPIYYLQSAFGFAGNFQLQLGVGIASHEFQFNDKSTANDNFTLKKSNVVFVKLGLGSGYQFPFGLLLTGEGSASVYPLTSFGDTTRFKGDGAYGEFEFDLTAGYNAKLTPAVALLPYAGLELTGAYEFFTGTLYEGGIDQDLEMQLKGRKSGGGYFGLEASWKKFFLKGEGHFGARKGFLLQTGVRL